MDITSDDCYSFHFSLKVRLSSVTFRENTLRTTCYRQVCVVTGQTSAQNNRKVQKKIKKSGFLKILRICGF